MAYPVGFNVTLPFHASVIRLLDYEMAKPLSQRLLRKVTHAAGLYVADNRTLLAQRLLDTDAEWLWMVDTDIEFQPNVLEQMIEFAGSDKKVLAASVPLGDHAQGGYPSCAFHRSKTPGVWLPEWPPLPMQPFEVDGIATACVLIHREVFETIAARHGQCWFHHIYLPNSPEGTPLSQFRYHSQGEDLAFSVRAVESGFKLWCAHISGLRHFKTYPFTHDAEFDAERSNLGKAVGEG